MLLRSAALAAAVLTACGAPHKPPAHTSTNGAAHAGENGAAHTGENGAAHTAPDAGATEPPPLPRSTAPMASEAQCAEVTDHVLSVLLASPDVPESAKEEWKEKAGVAREQMLRDCLRELTVPQYECLMSKRSRPALDECK